MAAVVVVDGGSGWRFLVGEVVVDCGGGCW